MHKAQLGCLPNNILLLFTKFNTNRPQRSTIIFDIPFARLTSSYKIVRIKGPRLYNTVVDKINKSVLVNCPVPKLQCRFFKNFKNIITTFLQEEQGKGDETWTNNNYIIITI